jgi:hypothetical protein
MILCVLTDNFNTKKGSLEPFLRSLNDDTLVRQLDCYRNRLCLSLYLLQERLAGLGLANVNADIVYGEGVTF